MSFINTSSTARPVIIGIDHGFGNIKTAHSCFKTGVTEYDQEPTFKSNLLIYDGRYYIIGDDHKEFTADKSQDQDYYILTLAAIAVELRFRDLTSARVYLAAGLPLWQQVFLSEYAPVEWADRAVLWNAVEENEKTKDSRLAREFVAALPVELNRGEWIALLTDFIQRQFVADGMCADVCIHDTDGHNPHAHIMLTVRPLDEKGKWQYKTEKEYLCIRNGEEQGLTAAEFKVARADGWEKQYPYMVDGKKVYMAPSEAEAHGYERVSKYPKSTKYGRQNPISARWNSDEQLNLWRASWADAVNLCLERKGLDERIDHRSHAERGLDEQPTIHEGVAARALEKKGLTSERCEINRQIKADNALLRELKAQVRKLMQAVRATVPAMAEAMERLRENMIVFRYQLRHISYGKGRLTLSISCFSKSSATAVQISFSVLA